MVEADLSRRMGAPPVGMGAFGEQLASQLQGRADATTINLLSPAARRQRQELGAAGARGGLGQEGEAAP